MNTSEERRRKSILNVERMLLEFSGISSEYFETGDLFLDESEHIHYSTVSKTCPVYLENKSNVLLLIHGLGGCGAMFYRLIPKLVENFYLVILDLPGFGFSTRTHTDPFDSTASCIDFFVDRLKVFVDKLGLRLFSIVCHSLGAFVSTHFFKKYHEQVQHLFLLSPAGMNHPTDDQQERLKQFFENQSLPLRFVADHVINKIFEKKESPFSLLVWPLKSLFIRFYLKNKRSKFSDSEKQRLSRLVDYFMTQPQCGEKSIGYLFYYGPMSSMPILDVLVEKKAVANRVSIIWGEHDIINQEDSTEQLKSRGLDAVRVSIAKDSEHQLVFQAIDHICEEIFKTLQT